MILNISTFKCSIYLFLKCVCDKNFSPFSFIILLFTTIFKRFLAVEYNLTRVIGIMFLLGDFDKNLNFSDN